MTRRYAIIGNPVAHSLSPDIHAAFARQTGIVLTYERLLAPLGRFGEAAQNFRASGGSGANVTVPFKRDAFTLSSRVSQRAARAQAANTLTFDGGEIAGDNTDGIGLVRDIRDNLGRAIAGKSVLVVGAGGAARGVIGPLLDETPARLAITNRTFAKAQEIATAFSGNGAISAVPLAELPAHRFDIVINATSAGLGDGLAPVPRNAFAAASFAYDMIYAKDMTPFLEMARQAGAKTADGIGMLVEQAAEAFMVWHGVRPDTAPLLAQFDRTQAPY